MRRFGLIGRPLGHSASAAYFTEKFNREGITDCEYSLYELGSIGDLPGLLERLPELCGLNVTIPYKRDVMAFLDSVSPEAEAIGAVNCIRRTADGKCIGNRYHLIYPPKLQYIGDIGLAVGRQVGKIHGKEITICAAAQRAEPVQPCVFIHGKHASGGKRMTENELSRRIKRGSAVLTDHKIKFTAEAIEKRLI